MRFTRPRARYVVLMSHDWKYLGCLRPSRGRVAFADAYCGGTQHVQQLPAGSLLEVWVRDDGAVEEIQWLTIQAPDYAHTECSVRAAFQGARGGRAGAALTPARRPRVSDTWTVVGGVGVDAGSIAAYDPDECQDDMRLEEHLGEELYGCRPAISWTSSGWGDGYYMIEADDPQQPTALRMLFIDSDDEE